METGGHWGRTPPMRSVKTTSRIAKVAHTTLVKFFSSLRQTFGGSAEAAENYPPRGGLHSRPVRQRTGFQRYTSVCCQPDYQHASG
ncbi:hypothetical protein NXW09_29600 [Bacteroides ovatus]|nr:hypothetical protein [Bacteroides ovatus]